MTDEFRGNRPSAIPGENGDCGSAMDLRGRPIGGTAGNSVLGSFISVIHGNGLPNESGPIIETVGVDDGAGTHRRFAHGADIDAATPANQKVGSPEPKR